MFEVLLRHIRGAFCKHSIVSLRFCWVNWVQGTNTHLSHSRESLKVRQQNCVLWLQQRLQDVDKRSNTYKGVITCVIRMFCIVWTKCDLWAGAAWHPFSVPHTKKKKKQYLLKGYLHIKAFLKVSQGQGSTNFSPNKHKRPLPPIDGQMVLLHKDTSPQCLLIDMTTTQEKGLYCISWDSEFVVTHKHI